MSKQQFYQSLNDVNAMLEPGEEFFLVSGRNSFTKSGALERLDRFLEIGSSHFYDFSPNPKIEDVERGVEKYKASGAKTILSVGGGSVLDMAKLIKGLSKSGNIRKDALENRVHSSESRIIAVPTTAGSGAESTPFAVVYIDGEKYSVQDDSILPEKVVLDSNLTYSMTPRQTAEGGMDALAQSIESYWSVNATEESRAYSLEAMRKVLGNLEDAVNNPASENKRAMLEGANLAGRAIAIAKTTGAHALSYAITSKYGIPHGHAVGLTLGQFLEFNEEVSHGDCNDDRGAAEAKRTMMNIFSELNTPHGFGAKCVIKGLMKSIGLETEIKGVGEEGVDYVMARVNEQRMKNNPRKTEESDLRKILGEVFVKN